MPKFELDWPLDRAGYELKPAVKSKKITAMRVPAMIVRKGGELEYRERMQIPGLYNQLADCSLNEKGALDFVSRFGFLSDKRQESVDFICSQIEVVRSLRKAKKARKWERLHLWMIDNRKAIRLNPDLLAGDPPELFFRPSTLLDAIYVQFFEDLTTKANLKLCERPGCRNWFKYGTGTGRRSTSQYCSPKCQNAAKYARMKEGG